MYLAFEWITSLLSPLRDVFTVFQPFVVVFNGFLGLVIGGMTLYLLIRTRPRKVKTVLLQPGALVINWSGHPLPEAPWLVPFRIWTPEEPPYFNVENWRSIQESIQKMMYNLPKDIQFRLLQGDPNVVIVIPQLAAGLAILLAVLHGQTGVFPSITCPLRNTDGSFTLPAPISLSEIRLNSRENRELKIG